MAAIKPCVLLSSPSLLCAYPARPVTCSHYLDALTEVCRTHTEVTGSPPEPELADLPH